VLKLRGYPGVNGDDVNHSDTAFGRNSSFSTSRLGLLYLLLMLPDKQERKTLTMTDPTLAENLDLDEEAYNSAEDEDFQLDAAPDESDLSSDADEAAEPAKKKRKTDTQSQIPKDAELDSGDEATIRKAREKKQKKTGKKPKGQRARDSDEDDVDIDMDDDEGGTGGFVRTRAMKQQM
jgi:hypothetical protein